MDAAPQGKADEETSAAALRSMMRQVPSPVMVVTMRSVDGQPFGITIGSFTSVSLEPPLVSFNVSKEANAFASLAAAERWAVHVPGHSQASLADRFADPALAPGEQFEGVGWRAGPGGVPVLEEAQAVLHCRPHARVPAGDSVLVIGQVTAVERRAAGGAGPLLYHQRAYRTVAGEASRSGRPSPETPTPKSAKS